MDNNKLPFDGIEHDEFDLTVVSIPDSVPEGRASTVSYIFPLYSCSLGVYGGLPIEGY